MKTKLILAIAALCALKIHAAENPDPHHHLIRRGHDNPPHHAKSTPKKLHPHARPSTNAAPSQITKRK